MTLFEQICRRCDEFIKRWPGSDFGPGHIVLADDNFEDAHLLFCLREAWSHLKSNPGDPETTELIEFLLELSGLSDEERVDPDEEEDEAVLP